MGASYINANTNREAIIKELTTFRLWKHVTIKETGMADIFIEGGN